MLDVQLAEAYGVEILEVGAGLFEAQGRARAHVDKNPRLAIDPHQIAAARLGVSEVVGAGAPRLWNTVSLIMPKYPSVRWIRILENAGFLVSAGSACSTGKASVSSVLLAMGVDSVAAGRVLRISSGSDTTAEDWDLLATSISTAYDALTAEASSLNSSVITID